MPTKTKERTYDIAIIGAGIAGTALAHALGSQGRSVLLLERDLSEPDRIVGELLQPGGVMALETLGLSGTVFSFINSPSTTRLLRLWRSFD